MVLVVYIKFKLTKEQVSGVVMWLAFEYKVQGPRFNISQHLHVHPTNGHSGIEMQMKYPL